MSGPKRALRGYHYVAFYLYRYPERRVWQVGEHVMTRATRRKPAASAAKAEIRAKFATAQRAWGDVKPARVGAVGVHALEGRTPAQVEAIRDRYLDRARSLKS